MIKFQAIESENEAIEANMAMASGDVQETEGEKSPLRTLRETEEELNEERLRCGRHARARHLLEEKYDITIRFMALSWVVTFSVIAAYMLE